jgi:hypothetical protein
MIILLYLLVITIKLNFPVLLPEKFGLRPGQFINPGGLGVDPEGNKYATNFGENNNVRKFQQRLKLFDNLWSFWKGPWTI